MKYVEQASLLSVVLISTKHGRYVLREYQCFDTLYVYKKITLEIRWDVVMYYAMISL